MTATQNDASTESFYYVIETLELHRGPPMVLLVELSCPVASKQQNIATATSLSHAACIRAASGMYSTYG